MSSIVIAGDTSGSVTIAAPAIAGTTVMTLPATTGTLLASGGALGTPSSGALTNCTGLPVAGGGTGVATTTAYGVLAGGTTATGAFQNIGTGTATQVLTSNGAGALPTFQASSGGVTTFAGGTTGLTPAGATSGAITLAGTLAVANGGTGVTTSTGTGANVLGTSPTLVTPALGTPASGVLTNCTGVARAALPAGSVLQVVSTNYTATASSTSATPADVSGFSAVITPISASSKILVSVSVCFGGAVDSYPYILVLRNGSSIGAGVNATGIQINTFLSGAFTSIASMPYRVHQFSKDYLDSPATTAALTYKIQLASPYSSLPAYINRQDNTSNAVYIQFPTSSITLMEIQG